MDIPVSSYFQSLDCVIERTVCIVIKFKGISTCTRLFCHIVQICQFWNCFHSIVITTAIIGNLNDIVCFQILNSIEILIIIKQSNILDIHIPQQAISTANQQIMVC